jgi:hypothetical protein
MIFCYIFKFKDSEEYKIFFTPKYNNVDMDEAMKSIHSVVYDSNFELVEKIENISNYNLDTIKKYVSYTFFDEDTDIKNIINNINNLNSTLNNLKDIKDNIEDEDPIDNSDIDIEINDKEKRFNLYYYNNYTNKINLINNDEKYLKLINDEIFPELSFINSFNDTIQNNNFFNRIKNNVYLSMEHAINSFEFLRNNTNKITMETVKEKFLESFETTSNIKDIMKSSSLQSEMIIILGIIENEDKIKKVKQLLPKILKELKLKKKRFSDGNYWYGIIRKKEEKVIKKTFILEPYNKNEVLVNNLKSDNSLLPSNSFSDNFCSFESTMKKELKMKFSKSFCIDNVGFDNIGIEINEI